MRLTNKLTGAAIVAFGLLSSGVALAGTTVEVPAPGVLGLVAIGVIAAIAVARGRK